MKHVSSSTEGTVCAPKSLQSSFVNHDKQEAQKETNFSAITCSVLQQLDTVSAPKSFAPAVSYSKWVV